MSADGPSPSDPLADALLDRFRVPGTFDTWAPSLRTILARRGLAVVPVEPTEAMENACLRAALDFMRETGTDSVWPDRPTPDPRENTRRCYRAMLAAAQEPRT